MSRAIDLKHIIRVNARSKHKINNHGLIQYFKKTETKTNKTLETENVTCLFFRDIKETENASHRLGKSIYKRPVSKLIKNFTTQ